MKRKVLRKKLLNKTRRYYYKIYIYEWNERNFKRNQFQKLIKQGKRREIETRSIKTNFKATIIEKQLEKFEQ